MMLKLMSLSPDGPRSPLNRVRRLGGILRDTLLHTGAVLLHGQSPTAVRENTQLWGAKLTQHVGVELEVKGQPLTGEPCLFVANHVSYLDIPILMSLLDLRFIAKAEVESWPIFGKAAASAGTVFMKRESARSRSEVTRLIGEAITRERKSIGIFPEGTSGMQVKPWKRGAFAVAQEFGFPVQAIRIVYDPLRPVAFIGDDDLKPHLWNMLGVPRLRASLEFFDPIRVTDAEAQTRETEARVRESFDRKLAEWQSEKSKA